MEIAQFDALKTEIRSRVTESVDLPGCCDSEGLASSMLEDIDQASDVVRIFEIICALISSKEKQVGRKNEVERRSLQDLKYRVESRPEVQELLRNHNEACRIFFSEVYASRLTFTESMHRARHLGI